jgi:hypothetical protein
MENLCAVIPTMRREANGFEYFYESINRSKPILSQLDEIFVFAHEEDQVDLNIPSFGGSLLPGLKINILN